MPGRQPVAEVVELEAHAIKTPGLERARLGMAVTVRQVQHAVGDAERRAVRRHVAEPGDQMRHRPVGHDVELDHRRTQELDRLPHRVAVEDDRAAVVGALVARRAWTLSIPRRLL